MTEENQPGSYEATKGDGVQPAELGYAPPDPGQGESAESEIPTGVDSLTDEQIQTAQENAPSGGDDDGGDGGDGGDDGGDGDALDVAALMEDGDADASGDDAEAEGNAADEAGEGATEMTDLEAQVAPDTGGA